MRHSNELHTEMRGGGVRWLPKAVGQAGGAVALMAARCARGEGPVRRRNASRRGAWRPAPAEVGDARPACSVDNMTGEGDMG
jgi:hypothetical protein